MMTLKRKTVNTIIVLAGLFGLLLPQWAQAADAAGAAQSEAGAAQSEAGVAQSGAGAAPEGPVLTTGEIRPDEGAAQSEAGEAQSGEDAAEVEQILENMTLGQKIRQMFVITPEALTGVGQVVQAGDTTYTALEEDPVGGLIYMEPNIQSVTQVQTMLSTVQDYSREITGLPLFLCVDEEGGTVRRISGHIWDDSGLEIPEIPDMLTVGQTGDLSYAEETGTRIGTYLKALGFNVDFAPDADVVADPYSSAIGTRSFGPDPIQTADMVAAVTEGIRSQGVCTALKHFPGHGAVSGDSHEGIVSSDKTLDQLRQEDLIPFGSGIGAGSEFVMAGHISYPNITGSDVPASLSKTFLTDILREEMGFRGLVITDALDMGAVVNTYSSADAAVMAVSAGADLLLMPADFRSAVDGVEGAVLDGRISEERIDQSVRRIISLKLRLEEQAAEDPVAASPVIEDPGTSQNFEKPVDESPTAAGQPTGPVDGSQIIEDPGSD